MSFIPTAEGEFFLEVYNAKAPIAIDNDLVSKRIAEFFNQCGKGRGYPPNTENFSEIPSGCIFPWESPSESFFQDKL